MSTASAAPQPTTTQLVMAMTASLAPLLGPYGVAADTLITAGMQMFTNLQASRKPGAANFTMEDLENAATKTTMDLADLAADVEASQVKAATGKARS